MQIVFIRHAESQNNYSYFKRRNYDEQVTDPPLSELGNKQAVELANFLAENKDEFNFDRVLISPFRRALQTATLFTPLYPDIPKIVWPWIHEAGGCFEVESQDPFVTVGKSGLTRSQINEQYPQFDVSAEITEEGWYFLPAVEPRSHTIYRAFYAVEHLVKTYGETDETIAMVSHGNFYNHFIHAIMRRAPQAKLWLSLENTGMTGVGYHKGYYDDSPENIWFIDYMNRHEWLHGKGLLRDWNANS